jgi:antitoxin component of MazEF toxin-antitoxin module
VNKIKKGKRQSQGMARMQKIHKIGNSLMVTLPAEWVAKHHLQEGDDIPVLADNILKVVPMSEAR